MCIRKMVVNIGLMSCELNGQKFVYTIIELCLYFCLAMQVYCVHVCACASRFTEDNGSENKRRNQMAW